MSIEVDAGELARAWLSVATAAATSSEERKNRPVLWHTVQVEQHAHGLRFTSTDSYMLLTAWVPEVDYELEEPPDYSEGCVASAVAIDPHGRAAGLMGHFLKLTKPDDADDNNKRLPVRVHLNVPYQDDEPEDGLPLEGLLALAVVIEQPEAERLQLPVYEGPFPHWRLIMAKQQLEKTDTVAVQQTLTARLAKAARPHGDTTVIKFWFAGRQGAIAVAFGEIPEVSGFVMPVRWDFSADAPYPEADKEEDE